ncbi:potassium/sodium hyperpolarization-activated cyclic nucleotide-gated channel 1-like [Sinocyclocheilus grahami]|uniref:potassium/sodium hyperpolarization-activated cyclic nucleotide-gated channel 1-like n=1 Tax=Sinocyclocheilus grahami TaxID=75366 RepID=UPI0007ACF554|nr:PREDICTED: potassium/sodium hyperpolarization-activated cyclic nucleotide-gated channel 1-like [Sinocyclocheilus grahami]
MCMVAITFLNLIGIPMEIAFLDGNSGVGWEGFNVFSDTLFLIDVGLNFRMGIINEDSEGAILDLKSIRQQYLKGWFIPDVVAAFPVGYILLIADLQYHSDSPSSKASKMMRILMFVRILSLVRLLRVSRLVRFFNEVERVSNANLEVVRVFLRILSLFMMIFLLCHWNGCIQYFVPMLEEFPSDCWVRRENLMNATVGEKYSFGVFRALSHMTAISYGSSETPTNEVELWIVMTSIVSGAIMYTVMVANTAAMMTDVDITARAYNNKMNHLEDYMTFMKLPKALRMHISNYFQARYAGKWYDEKDVLKWVSSSLREEILMTMCSAHVRKAPFFRNCDINFVNAILLELQYEVYQEGDIIIRQNAPGDRMFFIEHGQVLVENEFLQRELCDGHYFGESCLLIFCIWIEKHCIPSSPLLKGKKDLGSPPRLNNCPSTPELPAFETPFVSKLIKKDDRQEESDRHRTSQEGSFHLPDLSNTNTAPSFDAPEMPKVLCYEDKAIPEMLTLQSLFGSSLAFKNASDDASGMKMGADQVLDLKQTPVQIHENGFNQDWCLATPKVRVMFPTEPCTPEMPDISSVTQDILKLVAQCKS